MKTLNLRSDFIDTSTGETFDPKTNTKPVDPCILCMNWNRTLGICG
jgi:hypothetical protein